MEKQLAFYQTALNSLLDGVYFVDPQRRITYWNQAAERITGFRPDQTVGFRCQDNLLMHQDEHGTVLCTHHCPLSDSMSDGREREALVYVRHANGRYLPIMVRTLAVYDSQGKVLGGVEIFEDISALLAAESSLEDLEKAYVTDALTGLGNRRLAKLKIQNAIRQLPQDRPPFGLVLVDLECLTGLNQAYGYEAGDQALRLVAGVLTRSVGEAGFVARWSGDQFVLLLEDMDPSRLALVTEKVRAEIGQVCLPFGEPDLRLATSFGGVISQPEEELPELLLRGEAQLYRAKSSRRIAADL